MIGIALSTGGARHTAAQASAPQAAAARPAANSVSTATLNSKAILSSKMTQPAAVLPKLLPGEVRIVALGVDMLPPTTEQSAAVQFEASSAISEARSQAPVQGMATASVTSKLMIYSNVYGPKQADGTMTPSVAPTLAYVLTFTKSPELIVPPATFKGKLPSLNCQYVAVIGAISGAQLDAYQICNND